MQANTDTRYVAGGTRAQQGTLAYFIVVFSLTLGLQLPAVLAQHGVIPGSVQDYMPLGAIGAFGPILGAVLVSAFESGRSGVKALFTQLTRFGAKPLWYLVALLTPGAVLAAGLAVTSLFGASGRLVYLPQNPTTVAALFVMPFVEEVGWRGFAFPRLTARYGALGASVVFGLLWAAWHTNMMLIASFPLGMFPLLVPYFVSGSILFTWFFERPGGGLPLVILLHAGSHLSNSMQAVPRNMTPFVVQTVGFCIVATALVLLDRRTFGGAPRAAPNAP